ncbi:hypothetical protein EVG20_g8506 [Dentipellis fragilis]|uniref:Uncharacterized protein n=1 Tax=Dentipellis fragilis TaxID=205917 RepID=A0A4Y9Y7L0_9AGAM|nr:hypothetical protein EVG20_g8506 [Dentipellis fragilis]
MNVDINVGEIIRELRETFVGLFTWARDHHIQHRDRRGRIYHALAKHVALTFMESPSGIYPPWESLDYYRSNHFQARADPFLKAAAYGMTGTKAKIMMLFLWIIVRALPERDESRVRSIVSDVVSKGLGDDESIGEYKDVVRELVACFCRPLPQKIEAVLADPTMALHADLDHTSLLNMFRQAFPGVRKLEYDISESPSVLLYRQEGVRVLVPLNPHTQRVLAWSMKKLSMGHRVTCREDLRDDVCWNVYIPDPQPPPPPPPPPPPRPPPPPLRRKSINYYFNTSSRRPPVPSDALPRRSRSSHRRDLRSSTPVSANGKVPDRGASHTHRSLTKVKANTKSISPSPRRDSSRARAPRDMSEYVLLQGKPDSDILHAALKVIELCTKLLHPLKQTPRTKGSLICLALSIHPVASSLGEYPSASIPNLPSFFDCPRTYSGLPDPAAAQKRASGVAALLRLLGNRLSASRVSMLISTAVEHGILRALMLVKKGFISSEDGTAADIDPFRVLCTVADVVEDVAQCIKQPESETTTIAPDDADEDDIVTRTPTEDPGVPYCALDIKETPSALLHRQTVLLLPKTKLTMRVLERLINDFAVGSPASVASGGPRDVAALWVVQFPLGHRMQSIPVSSPHSYPGREARVEAANYRRRPGVAHEMPEMDYTQVVRKIQRRAQYIPDPMDDYPMISREIPARECPQPVQVMRYEVPHDPRLALRAYDVVVAQGPTVMI